ncbi:hypothetical protein LRAMOSA03304 [Lichtheimia ramosa]|uniref:Uncharacterized protein n=1 Tax=Lichtheimia ramosa TaxID=688394 RepID=A0A077WUQ2_9FUNG|nr:hypothetical protein LRAMOSA03304 [Lichtheimia ramosa]
MWWRQVDWEVVSGLPLDAIDKFEWAFVKFRADVSEKEFHDFALRLGRLINPTAPSPFSTLALPSFSSSPAPPPVFIKTEPVSPPLEAIKAEPLSSSLLPPFVPVKV